MNPTARKYALPIAFLAIGLPVGIWAMLAMGDPQAAEKASDKAAFRSVSTTALGRDDLRAEARWEPVTTLTGTGPADKSFDIARRAIQWRVGWNCKSGKFHLTAGGDGASKVVTDMSCPSQGAKVLVGSGPSEIGVKASGDWRVSVRQQVDTPLEEPPLAGMTPASLIARGRFHRIQKRGEGTLSLYKLPSGRLALRYSHFYTAPSPGLELWLSTARNPHSTLDARSASHINAGPMRSTYGNYNQVLARRITADQFKSVVVWCPTVLIAFSAASLR